MPTEREPVREPPTDPVPPELPPVEPPPGEPEPPLEALFARSRSAGA